MQAAASPLNAAAYAARMESPPAPSPLRGLTSGLARGDDAALASFNVYAQAARLANSLGLGVNAGHDLDLDNLELFASMPHLDEVSIGHAIFSDALYRGLETVVRDYLELLGVEHAT